MSKAKPPHREIPTDAGRAGFGDNYFKGYRILADLAGAESAWSLTSMAIDGPRLSQDVDELLDYLATASMVTDPRIWLFKICRLVAAYGSPLVAQGAAKVVLEEAFLGPNALRDCARALIYARAKLGEMVDTPSAVQHYLERWFERHGIFPGFGVVGREVDERHRDIEQWYERTYEPTGDFWRLSRRLVDAADRSRGVQPNVAMAVTPILLDLGYDPDQIKQIFARCTDIIFAAMSYEGAKHTHQRLQKVDEDEVIYTGPSPRRSPRASEP